MARKVLSALVGVAVSFTFTAVFAQGSPPDTQNGLAVAERLCATCHAVDPQAVGIRPDVPSFSVIASLPGMTPERLAGSIILPHPAMPGVALTRAELRDVIAYIVSLRP